MIISYLEPIEYINSLQFVNKEMYTILNQNDLWENISYRIFNSKNIEEYFKFLKMEINLKQFYFLMSKLIHQTY